MNVKWYLLVVLTCIPWKIGDVCSDQECSFWFVWSFGLAFYILHHGCSGNTEFPRYWRSLSLSLNVHLSLAKMPPFNTSCLSFHWAQKPSYFPHVLLFASLLHSPQPGLSSLLGCPVSPDFFSLSLCAPIRTGVQGFKVRFTLKQMSSADPKWIFFLYLY